MDFSFSGRGKEQEFVYRIWDAIFPVERSVLGCGLTCTIFDCVLKLPFMERKAHRIRLFLFLRPSFRESVRPWGKRELLFTPWPISFAVIRDSASTPRHDGTGSEWGGKNRVYPHFDESYDGLRDTSQRNENEPQGYHCTSDVWTAGCGYKWLDWWNLLYSLEEDASCQERFVLKLCSLQPLWPAN